MKRKWLAMGLGMAMVCVTDLMSCHRLARMNCPQIDELSVISPCRAAA